MMKILVIGGGISGLLTAWELQRAGARVTVVERDEIGRESSWAGGGIISPLYPWRYPEAVTALATWSQAAYPGLAEMLLAATGVDPELLQSGLLIFPDRDELPQARSWAADHGAALEIISPEQVREVEAVIKTRPDQAAWLPQVAQVRNPLLLNALHALLLEAGVEFRSHSPVESLTVSVGRVRGVVCATGALEAERVVVAGGAWSRGILGPYAANLEIEPVRGQMLLYKAEPGLLKRIVLHNNHYLIPRRDGHILAGSTVEHVGFDKSITAKGREELAAAAQALMPALADYPVVRHWAGLRPGTFDGTPYISAHPEVEGLYVNAGHFRNGVAIGPAAARLAADLILEREPILAAEPYALRLN